MHHSDRQAPSIGVLVTPNAMNEVVYINKGKKIPVQRIHAGQVSPHTRYSVLFVHARIMRRVRNGSPAIRRDDGESRPIHPDQAGQTNRELGLR